MAVSVSLKNRDDQVDRRLVDRRLADKRLAQARQRRTVRYVDHSLLDLFKLLEQAEERLRGFRESATGHSETLERLLADLDEVRNEIEARGICPYHQAALTVCCLT